jgi:hypothetical protein
MCYRENNKSLIILLRKLVVEVTQKKLHVDVGIILNHA